MHTRAHASAVRGQPEMQLVCGACVGCSMPRALRATLGQQTRYLCLRVSSALSCGRHVLSGCGSCGNLVARVVACCGLPRSVAK